MTGVKVSGYDELVYPPQKGQPLDGGLPGAKPWFDNSFDSSPTITHPAKVPWTDRWRNKRIRAHDGAIRLLNVVRSCKMPNRKSDLTNFLLVFSAILLGATSCSSSHKELHPKYKLGMSVTECKALMKNKYPLAKAMLSESDIERLGPSEIVSFMMVDEDFVVLSFNNKEILIDIEVGSPEMWPKNESESEEKVRQ